MDRHVRPKEYKYKPLQNKVGLRKAIINIFNTRMFQTTDDIEGNIAMEYVITIRYHFEALLHNRQCSSKAPSDRIALSTP